MADGAGGRRIDQASRVIAASPQAIYRAFIDPEAWTTWLPPEGMTARVDKFGNIVIDVGASAEAKAIAAGMEVSSV